jgi:hypothetical protein
MKVSTIGGRWRNRPDADVGWRKDFLGRLADVDGFDEADDRGGPTSGQVPVGAAFESPPEAELSGFAAALKSLDAGLNPPQPQATNPETPYLQKLTPDQFGYWDSIDANRRLVDASKRVQRRAEESIRRGAVLVAASCACLLLGISALILLQISSRETAIESTGMIADDIETLLASPRGAIAKERPANERSWPKVPTGSLNLGRLSQGFTDSSSEPKLHTASIQTAKIINTKRPDAVAPTPTLSYAITVDVSEHGFISIPLRFQATQQFPAGSHVLLDGLPGGLVPTVGTHVAYGAWKLKIPELEEFLLVVGAEAPNTFTMTLTVIDPNSTVMGSSVAAIELRRFKPLETANNSVLPPQPDQRRAVQVSENGLKMDVPRARQAAPTFASASNSERPAPQGAPAAATLWQPPKSAPERPSTVNTQKATIQANSERTNNVPARRQHDRRAKSTDSDEDSKETEAPVTRATPVRRERPNTELKMSVGVHVVPAKPMRPKLETPAAAPTPRQKKPDADWKQEMRENLGAR